jgi:hypothetical protein
MNFMGEKTSTLKKERIKIGWADADITPEGKVELYGQYYQRVSEGVHSSLGLTVMVMESESGEQIIMVSLDTVGIPLEFVKMVRERTITRVPEIVPDKIIINATHVHTAPALSSAMNWLKYAEGTIEPEHYREFVLSHLVKTISDAWENRAFGSLATAHEYAVIGHCRRAVFKGSVAEMYGDTSREDFTGLEGSEDPTAEILFTYDEDKNPTGVIINIACPAQVMEATYLVSSDFTGETRRLLQSHFGGNFKTLCQISSAGDQSPRDLIRNRNADFWNEKGVSILGERLYMAVIQAYEGINANEISFNMEILHSVTTVNLPRWFPSQEETIKAEKEIKKLTAAMDEKEAFADFNAEVKRNEKIVGKPGPYDSKLHHFVLIKNTESIINRALERNKVPAMEMELHVLRVGEIVFCTNPFELFLDYGLRIKARSKARQTFIIQLCCGNSGYLPTEKAERHGGYGALINNCTVGSEGGESLVEETVKTINRLFAEG